MSDLKDKKIELLLELLSEGQRQVYWSNDDKDLGVMGRYPQMAMDDWMHAVDDVFGYLVILPEKREKKDD